MEAFNRCVRIGTYTGTPVTLEIRWDETRLSICGEHRTSAGQIISMLTEEPMCPKQGIDIPRLVEVWETWHLNDMQAGCEHQRAQKWNERPIDTSKPTNSYGIHFEGQHSSSWNMLVWVRQDDHPEGLLGKPCQECGYKYGTAWLYKEVPEEVLEFLKNLGE